MSEPSSLLPPPLGFRKNIPLYYPKTEEEIKADRYERYNPQVLRSCRNFYEGSYGMTLLQEVIKFLPAESPKVIVELGCGTGYLLGNLAKQLPDAACLGFDYSYQMLKMASQVFVGDQQRQRTLITGLQNGMEDLEIENHQLSNISFALSDACLTPLPDNSVDFCYSCFLWDRVADPAKLLEEKIRILKQSGTIMILSPFNYLSKRNWDAWYPMQKLINKIEEKGLQLKYHNTFTIDEWLDVRKNKVVWQVESLVFSHKEKEH